jgi:hypothetical protein
VSGERVVRRRLAAILAADVAGYSRLMSADEEGTHERLKAHRRELVDPKIGEHSGRIVKTTGDGMLVEFASVVDAVRCSAELQRAMMDREAGLPDERRIRFRIGINLGDVIVEGEGNCGEQGHALPPGARHPGDVRAENIRPGPNSTGSMSARLTPAQSCPLLPARPNRVREVHRQRALLPEMALGVDDQHRFS